ncbi:MAG TPA: TraR/DksA family transcriptional regulator, partial [Gammaproteobacteria bacterium]|nr:TraR/DksA family transcriptional regulator [Gammaproteobacteria bacterium]
MENNEIETYRERLLELKREIEQLQEASKEATKPVELDQASVGRVSRIDAIQGQQMARETARRRQHHLVKIEGALRRIETGDFGHCFVCGTEIDARRLAADPTITR